MTRLYTFIADLISLLGAGLAAGFGFGPAFA